MKKPFKWKLVKKGKPKYTLFSVMQAYEDEHAITLKNLLKQYKSKG